MKKLWAFLSICLFWTLLHAQTPRNLIVTLDWYNERIAEELNDTTSKPEEIEKSFGPVTGELTAALAQKAAPIITTSSLWHNFVAHRRLFEDFLADQGFKYKNKYKRFNDATIEKFQETVQAYFQPSGEKLRGSPTEEVLFDYLLCYGIPFEKDDWIIKKASDYIKDDWIIKKASDYIYVLVPKEYLEKLKSNPLPQSKSERNFAMKLEDDDLYLGLKITAMPTMSYQDALDPDKHKLSIDEANYTQLISQKDMQMIMELSKKKITVVGSFIIGKHFINILKDIFVTQRDLVDKNKDDTKTDLNRALFLHKWHIYLTGHGDESDL
jgi:hypothetical protein